MTFDYKGKIVFVSGGTSGINFGVAKAFSVAGAGVFVISRREEKVKSAIASIGAMGGRADGCTADVRDADAVTLAFDSCRQTFGEIDVLVSGAAGNFPAKANQISSNGFRAVIEIDLLGTHHVLTAAYPHLRKPGATVINISAPQAVAPMIAQSHVCAAKAGIDMITRVLAMEWGPSGVRVNSVIPGPIENTEGMDRLAPTPEATADVIESVPLRRLGQASDIADMCMFLGSDNAAYVSGAIIPVDGGWYISGAAGSLNPILDALTGANGTSNA